MIKIKPFFKTNKKVLLVDISVFLIIIFSSAIISVALGQDANFDLKNYHFYNPYAFFNNRYDIDIIPANLQSYYNPILDIPFYFGVWHLSPKIITFILGMIQGVNVFLIFLISRDLLVSFLKGNGVRTLVAFSISVISIYAPGMISELGTVMQDNISSIPCLLSIYVFLKSLNRVTKNTIITKLPLFMCGFFLGIALGIKLTNIIYVIGFIIALIFYIKIVRKNILFFILGLSLGLLLFGGYWMVFLYRNYDNPLFPYYNHIFKSPFGAQINFRDLRFMPKNIWEYIIYPVIFNYQKPRVSELPFRDYRILILYICSLLYFTKRLVEYLKHKRIRVEKNVKKFDFMILFFLSAYVTWLLQFSIYRYIILLELISPLLIFVIVFRIINKRRVVALHIVSFVFLFLVFSMKPLNWGRVDYSKNYFDIVFSEDISVLENSIVLCDFNYYPAAYTIPFFPSSTRFVNINDSYVDLFNNRKEIESLVNNSENRFYLLHHLLTPINASNKLLFKYNMEITEEELRVQTVYETFILYQIDPLNKVEDPIN